MDAATGEVLAERAESIGVATNNVAEYGGLIAGLAAAKQLGASSVRVRMDSKLVVEQMCGRWKIKHPSMIPLARQASELAKAFSKITFEWIPRLQNSYADRLANEAMDAAARGRPVKHIRSAANVDPADDVGSLRQDELPLTLSPNKNQPAMSWLPPDTRPTRLILVRHGVTKHSIEKRFSGRSDPDLIDEGVEQATRAARRIADLEPIDAVISSPLRRARQTAAKIADMVDLPVTIEDRIMETDFGDWDECTFAEVGERWSAELADWLADPAIAPPGGESFEVVARRVRQARDRILAKHARQTVVLVSHVSPIKILVQLALGAPMSALHRMHLDQASLSVIDYFTDGGVSLRSFNDTAHLSSTVRL
jgi:probable phosphoglycerate mutase